MSGPALRGAIRELLRPTPEEEPPPRRYPWCCRCGRFVGRCCCREPLVAADWVEVG